MDVDSPVAGPSTSAAGATAAPLNLPINLFTRDLTHSIPQSTYFIPSTWRRYQLSELINRVLKTSQTGLNDEASPAGPVPFDFIIDGQLLRGSLDAWVAQNRDGDVESTINVEYIQSLLPPKALDSFPQDDWVSGVSIQRSGYILMSSYLSHLKVIPLLQSTVEEDATPHAAASDITLPLPSTLGATSCSWLSPSSTDTNILLGAGGMDRHGHIFSIPSLLDSERANVESREIMTLHLHTEPISSLTPSRDFAHVLTTGWDGLLGLFALPTLENPLEESHDLPADPTSYLPGQNRKKRKIAAAASGGASKDLPIGWRKQPTMVMRGHVGRVAGAVWDKHEHNKAWSVGWDGSVRGWEAESGYAESTRQGPGDKAGLCIDQMSGGSGRLVSGSMDRTISFWDTREATTLISLSLQTSSPVPSIRCHPTSTYTLASATYSGTLQIWDVRSPKQALFSVRREPKAGKGERVLGVDWDGSLMIAGGEDGEVGVWSARGE